MRIDVWGWSRDASRGDHRDFLRLFETADALGFAGAWFNEFRFQTPPQPYPSILLLAAAIFARTERLRVGTAVLVLPMHEPHLLAEEIAQLDWQSGGRIDIGLGRGTLPESFRRIGVDPATTRERFEAGYQVLLESWHGLVAVQRPHPPLYIAGASRETLQFAAERDLPLLLSLEPGEAGQLAICDEIEQDTGRRADVSRSSLARYVAIGATPAKAQEAAEVLLDRLHERRREIMMAHGMPSAPMNRDRILASQFVHGTPDQCIAQIRAHEARLGIDKMRCVFNGKGVLDNDTAVAAMTLFAREVLPVVQGTA